MNGKTILYIGGFEFPDKNAAAHRVLSNAKILRKLGYTIKFVGIDKELPPNVGILETSNMVNGFEYFSVSYPRNIKQWANYITDSVEYIKLCQKIDASAIIMYNFQSIAMYKIMIFCHKNNIKCFADVTEWYLPKGNGFFHDTVKRIDTLLRMRFLHKKMDGLIVISRFLENYYKIHTKTVYLPALTDLEDEKWNIDGINKDKSTLYLVYAGSPGKKDKIEYLIDSLMKVQRNIRLDIIGINKQEYLNEHNEHLHFLTDNHNIFFHGRISHTETLDYVKKANYSCFFREKDIVSTAGFPTKFAEAISCGTPVITNKTSNISEYVHEGDNGFIVDELSNETISNLIEKVPYECKVNRYLFYYENYKNSMGEMFRE